MSTHEANGKRFGKEQMVQSALFAPRDKDVLNVMLQDDKSYTLGEAKEVLELFLNTMLSR